MRRSTPRIDLDRKLIDGGVGGRIWSAAACCRFGGRDTEPARLRPQRESGSELPHSISELESTVHGSWKDADGDRSAIDQGVFHRIDQGLE